MISARHFGHFTGVKLDLRKNRSPHSNQRKNSLASLADMVTIQTLEDSGWRLHLGQTNLENKKLQNIAGIANAVLRHSLWGGDQCDDHW